MDGTLKLAVASLLSLLFGIGFLFLGWEALSRGSVSVGKYNPIAIQQLESPVAFYFVIGITLLCGMVLLAGSAACWFSRGDRRGQIVSYIDSSLLRVRPSVRWLLICLVVVIAVLTAVSLLRS